MTKKCSLNCQHCFEGDALNQKEQLSQHDLRTIVQNLLSQHVGQIILSGGDPLNRYSDLLQILQEFKAQPIDFWINTSGYSFSREKARQLKEAGLRGITFSLDHFIPELHDQFRGREGVFEKVVAGVQSAHDEGLISALSLCATNEFISSENLDQFLGFARQLGVAFLQILEPKSVGRNALSGALLTKENRGLLEKAYADYMATRRPFGGYPILSYPDFQQRRFGCFGGKRYVYIDTAGKVHPCPFCKDAQQLCKP